MIALVLAIVLGASGGYWLTLKLGILQRAEVTTVGFDVIVIAYLTFGLCLVCAIAAVFLATSSGWLRIAARCMTAVSLVLMALWLTLHWTGKVISYESMYRSSHEAVQPVDPADSWLRAAVH